MRINNVARTCKLMTAALKDLTRKAAHHLVVNLILSCHTCKRRESTSVGIDASVKNKWKFWRWLKEKVETGLCLASRESEMCVSDCIQKINVSGQAFCSWCHEVRTSKSKFCLFFCFKFTSYYFDIALLASFVAETRILTEMKLENLGKKIFSVGKNR